MKHPTIVAYNQLLLDLGVSPEALQAPTFQTGLQAGLVQSIAKNAAVVMEGISNAQDIASADANASHARVTSTTPDVKQR